MFKIKDKSKNKQKAIFKTNQLFKLHQYTHIGEKQLVENIAIISIILSRNTWNTIIIHIRSDHAYLLPNIMFDGTWLTNYRYRYLRMSHNL